MTDLVAGNQTVGSEDAPMDQALTLDEAGQRIGVSFAAVTLWVGQKRILSEKNGRSRFIRESVCVLVKELRETHGKSWYKHAPWYDESAQAESEEISQDFIEEEESQDLAADASAGDDQEETEEAPVEISDENWTLFWNNMKRAKVMFDDGKPEAACGAIFSLCEEFNLL